MAPTYYKPTMTSSANAASSTVTAINASARPRLVAPLIESLDYMSVPLLKLFKKGKPIDNPKYEWTDEKFAPTTATTDAGTHTDTETPIDLASGHGARISANTLLFNPATGEIIYVSSVSTDALTVTRGWGSTAGAAIAANQPLTIIGPAVPEKVDSPAAVVSRGEFYYNFIQQIVRAISVSDIQNNTNNRYLTKGKELSSEKMRQMKEGFRDLERAYILGVKNEAATTLPYSLGGMYEFTTNYTTANAGAVLTEAQVLAKMEQTIADVGPDEVSDLIVCHYFLKQVMSSWVDGLRQATAQDTKYKFKMTVWENDLGVFQFLVHHHNPAADLICINPAHFRQLPYSGMDWQEEDLARTGTYQNSHLFSTYTLEAKGDRSRWKITGSSTTRSAYDTLPQL